MSDPFSWSINLGRWAGVPVRVHFLLVLFAAVKLLGASLFDAEGEGDPIQTAAWLGLLLLALAAHELGHAAAAWRLGMEPDEIRLWPLGNLAGPHPVPVSRSREAMAVALAGPLTSLSIAAILCTGLLFADARMVLNPFGLAGSGSGAPTVGGEPVEALGAIWLIGWFGYLNWVLFLANLIPALPMDAGRALRAYLAGPALSATRDGLIAPWMARSFAVLLAIIGVIRILFFSPNAGGFELLSLAILIELMVRHETRMLEEGGYYEDSLFGYDFSEGYTSLEGSGPKVRPYRENALARWRRRRSDARRQRQTAKEAAEERRMDEILAKIHTSGRDSLSPEEQRFLARVSTKYRKRTRTRG
ncbi:site-2 protease family protein [Tautonia plasticadhaerens]|uniref:Zinc metalloprotease Rip3 n=1 Tax=Tautonia plasticadhaerens TaxID=2527974 RepID=A0A518HD11_9BACT|nr:site-2 protease family protein [Tautonia plasticadhaerens]QDV38741.1 Putative zinc metalloprotease Rip3 [Tautonia plasticadhaerens]